MMATATPNCSVRDGDASRLGWEQPFFYSPAERGAVAVEASYSSLILISDAEPG